MEMSWLFGLAGGLMIGLAAAAYLLLNGRIAGISGVIGAILSGSANSERLAFLAGLIAAPAGYALFVAPPEVNATLSAPVLIAAGLLVGVGTRLGSGCTSGHGVCGMSRFSLRSIAAAATFMAAGALVVTFGRHVIGGL